MSDERTTPGFLINANTSKVLMSDVLRGNVPELEDAVEDASEKQVAEYHAVIVLAQKSIKDPNRPPPQPFAGILRGVLFGLEPEIEFRVEMKEAMDIIEAPDLSFDGFELHHGERIIKMPGPFIIKAARIDEISPQEQLCTLGLHLKKQAR